MPPDWLFLFILGPRHGTPVLMLAQPSLWWLEPSSPAPFGFHPPRSPHLSPCSSCLLPDVGWDTHFFSIVFPAAAQSPKAQHAHPLFKCAGRSQLFSMTENASPKEASLRIGPLHACFSLHG